MLAVLTSSTEDNLTTLAAAQQVIGAPSSDEPYLERLMTRASRWAETYVGQPLLAQTYVEALAGKGGKTLLLSRTPVRSVTRIISGSSSTADGTLLGSTEYRIADAEAGVLWRDARWLWGGPTGGDVASGAEPNVDDPNYWVTYEAGYLLEGDETTGRTLPEEIEQAVILKVKQLYGGDGSVASKRLGDYAVTYRTEGPDEPATLLEPFRRVA